jgi:poly-gamma-glutamate capsule biosynthesis protein CapA/YwtB (metallophosphatase superfamily)
MNDDEREVSSIPRRALLCQAGRAGLGIAAGAPLASWLASCATQPSATQRPTPTSAPTTVPTATLDTRPITIAITGDLMLARSVGQRLLATSDTFPFIHTTDYLRSFDLTVGNLECVVSTLGAPQPKQYTFEAPPRSFERLVAAGFDIVSLANNHSGDYGKTAFGDMLGKLPGYGLTPVGGGLNRAAAHAPVIRKVHSTTLGFLAYCEIQPQSFAATDATPGHAWLEEASMRADIQAARPQADYLIVFQHWGVEYETVEPSTGAGARGD